MTTDRINDEIDRLMDEAFEALRAAEWATVADRARAVLAFDSEHEEASRLLSAAGRLLDAGTSPETHVPSSTADDVTPDEDAAPEVIERSTALSDGRAAGRGRSGRAVGAAARAARAVLRPLLVPIIIPLAVLVGAAIAADRGGLWDVDGPLADTGLVDADGLLTRLRIAGDDRLVWKLPFVGAGADADDGTPADLSVAELADAIEPLIDRFKQVPATPAKAEQQLQEFVTEFDRSVGPRAEPSAILEAWALAQARAVAADPSLIEKIVERDRLMDGAMTRIGPAGEEGASRPLDRRALPARFVSSAGAWTLRSPGVVAFDRTPGLEIFYVNGINTDSQSAAAAQVALARAFGQQVVLFYNHGFAEELQSFNYTEFTSGRICERALALHAEDLEEGFLAWLERATLGDACRIEAAGIATGVVVKTALEALRGTLENAAQRASEELVLGGWDFASSAVNSRLVPAIEGAITNGNSVIVVGHSQGTMFVDNATVQVNAWWSDLVAANRACGRPALGSLYLAPAANVRSSVDGEQLSNSNDPSQRYVLLTGDMLVNTLVAWLPETAQLTDRQLGGPLQPITGLHTHSILNYLTERTFSREQIDEFYVALTQWVLDRRAQVIAPVGEGLNRIVIEQTDGSTAAEQGGATDSYTVRLACRPEVDVALELSYGWGDLVVADPKDITFTPSTWSTPRTVIVTALRQDSPVLCNGDPCDEEEILYSATSADAEWEERFIQRVDVAIAASDALMLSSVGPFVHAGVAGQTVTVRGQGFLSGSHTVVYIDAPGIVVTSQQWVSSTELTLTVLASADAEPGIWPAHVVNPDAEVTLPRGLLVLMASEDEPTATPAAAAAIPPPTATPASAATPPPAPAEQFSIAVYRDTGDYEYYFVHPTADTGPLLRQDLRSRHGFCTGNTNTTPAPYTLVRGPFSSREAAVAAFVAELSNHRVIGLGCFDPVGDLAGSNRGWVYLSREIARALEAR